MQSMVAKASLQAGLLAAVRRMTELSNHPFLIEKHCGGKGHFDSIEEFLAAFQDSQIHTASVKKKQELSAVRRSQFNVRRPELELAFIERDGYVCCHPECSVTTDLTIDYILALSKGGH